MAFKAPSIGRSFAPDPVHGVGVNFGSLSPLAAQSPWSVLALVHPTGVSGHGGIVTRRLGFEVGTNEFGCWLSEGALVVGADSTARFTTICPPLNQWSMIGAALSQEGSDHYMGLATGLVTEQSLEGITTGAPSSALELRVGWLGDGFPGTIGLICIYSAKLPAEVMRGACSGEINPLDIPALVFAWQPSAQGDSDLISKRVPVIAGTRLWPAPPQANADLLKPPVAQPAASSASQPTAAAVDPAGQAASDAPPQSRAEAAAPSTPNSPAPAPAVLPNVAFMMAGHSHLFALGATQAYQGAISLQPVSAQDVDGAILMDTWTGNRSREYWTTLAKGSRERVIFISYGGNQHYSDFMFAAEPFDFLERESDVPGDAPLVSRKLIRAHFARSMVELNEILAMLAKAGARKVYVIGTPPPKPDIKPWLESLRDSAYFQELAAKRGIDMSPDSLTPAALMLKMWRVIQELMQEIANTHGANYLPPPPDSADDQGFLKAAFHADATHANDDYGKLVMQMIGSAVREHHGQ